MLINVYKLDPIFDVDVIGILSCYLISSDRYLAIS